MNIVYNCDNMEFMAGVRNKFFHLAFPDPPYGIGASCQTESMHANKGPGRIWKGAHTRNIIKKNWDNTPPDDKFFQENKRVSINQAIWGANYFKQIVGKPFKPIRRKNYDDFIKKNPTNWFIWDKINGNNNQSDCEMLWCSVPIETEIYYYLWAGFRREKPIHRIHPTQKPVDVYSYFLRRFCKPGYKIFDSHVGSGSSRISADKLGLDFIGCENDKDHFFDQEKRYKNYLLQKNKQPELLSMDDMQDCIYDI